MNNKYFYAVTFISGRGTTTGQPNPKTGRMDKAIRAHAFTSKKERDDFVSNGKFTSAMRGNSRASVTKKELRSLRLGHTLAQFYDFIEYLNSTAQE